MAHRHRFDTGSSICGRLVAWLPVVALMLFTSVPALAQNPAYSFAVGIGAGGHDYGNAISVDGSGSIYVTGSFKGTADFDPGPGTANLTATAYEGAGDIFVASYDAAGNYRWAFSVGGPPPTGMQADNTGLAIAVDFGGNVVVSGFFNGTMDFDPGPATASLATNGRSTFVARYTPTGNYLWAFKIGPYSPWNDLAIDGNGNVILAGTFKYTVDFDPGPGTANLTSVKAKGKNTGGDQSDIFVAKYSSSGAYLWAFRVGNDYEETADAVDVDGDGFIYVTGSLNSNAIDFDPGRNTSSLTGRGTYVAKYTSAGAYQWAFKLGSADFTADRQRIDVDRDGNVVLAGGFTGTVDFDPGAGTANLTGRSANGSLDIFVARYSSGGAYRWAFSPSIGSGLGLTVDAGGEIYVTGNFRGDNDFDPGSGVALLERDATYDNGGFVASYDRNGYYRWAFSIPTAATYGRGIVSASGPVYLTGSYRLTADFDPSDAVASLTPVALTDIFVAKYDDFWWGLKPARESARDIELTTAPNPFTDAITVRFDLDGDPVRLDVIDLMGRTVESHDAVDARAGVTLGDRLPAGTYVVRLTRGEIRRQVIVRKER